MASASGNVKTQPLGSARKFGLDVARVVLGHPLPAITELNAELDFNKALEIIFRVASDNVDLLIAVLGQAFQVNRIWSPDV